jgi:hypothetical protein
MKRTILFILFMIVSMTFVTAQINQGIKNPVGSWKFEAPYAPEGYTSGTIIVGLTEQKYTTQCLLQEVKISLSEKRFLLLMTVFCSQYFLKDRIYKSC